MEANAFSQNWKEENDPDFPKCPNIPRFKGPVFESQTNKSKNIFNIPNPHTLTPLQWFLLYLCQTFWESIVDFTNSQATNDREWTDLTLPELWIFLALLFLRAIKSFPSYRGVWSTDWKFSCPKVGDLMSRRRVELIRKHIKFNNGEEDSNDTYWRVRSILDKLRSNCKRIVKPTQKLSLDEMSPAFRGRSKETISIKGKKSKKHFNIRALTLPNGAMYTFYLRHENLELIENDEF